MLTALRRMLTEPTGRRASLALAAVGWGVSTLLRVRDDLADEMEATKQAVSGQYDCLWPELVTELRDRIGHLTRAVNDGSEHDTMHEIAMLEFLHNKMSEELADLREHLIPSES